MKVSFPSFPAARMSRGLRIGLLCAVMACLAGCAAGRREATTTTRIPANGDPAVVARLPDSYVAQENGRSTVIRRRDESGGFLWVSIAEEAGLASASADALAEATGRGLFEDYKPGRKQEAKVAGIDGTVYFSTTRAAYGKGQPGESNVKLTVVNLDATHVMLVGVVSPAGAPANEKAALDAIERSISLAHGVKGN